eukprot:1144674-Pelagomonas_calceolata.AAC.1
MKTPEGLKESLLGDNQPRPLSRPVSNSTYSVCGGWCPGCGAKEQAKRLPNEILRKLPLGLPDQQQWLDSSSGPLFWGI